MGGLFLRGDRDTCSRVSERQKSKENDNTPVCARGFCGEGLKAGDERSLEESIVGQRERERATIEVDAWHLLAIAQLDFAKALFCLSLIVNRGHELHN